MVKPNFRKSTEKNCSRNGEQNCYNQTRWRGTKGSPNRSPGDQTLLFACRGVYALRLKLPRQEYTCQNNSMPLLVFDHSGAFQRCIGNDYSLTKVRGACRKKWQQVQATCTHLGCKAVHACDSLLSFVRMRTSTSVYVTRRLLTTDYRLTFSSSTTNKMPSALILIADGTEEIEFVTPYDGAIAARSHARP